MLSVLSNIGDYHAEHPERLWKVGISARSEEGTWTRAEPEEPGGIDEARLLAILDQLNWEIAEYDDLDPEDDHIDETEITLTWSHPWVRENR